MPNGRRCRVCGKIRYATQEAALNVIAKASDRRRAARAYYSSRCGWWHVTSRQDKEAAAATGTENGNG
jgi:hypothetical protein